MYLIQILLPVQNEHGHSYDRKLYDDLARDLTNRFGEVTAYAQGPGQGLWDEGPGRAFREPVVTYEVMVDVVEREWWAALRERLAIQFDRGDLVVRAQEVSLL